MGIQKLEIIAWKSIRSVHLGRISNMPKSKMALIMNQVTGKYEPGSHSDYLKRLYISVIYSNICLLNSHMFSRETYLTISKALG